MREVRAMSIARKKALFTKARRVYYNSKTGETLMSDKVFDLLESLIAEEDSDWLADQGTGAPVRASARLGAKTERKLARPCASLNKVRPNDPNRLSRFQARIAELSPYCIVMPKLDGSSLFAEYAKGVPVSLCTRGDGVTGKDISFLLPYTTLPKSIPDKDSVSVRLEAVVKVDTWRAKWTPEKAGSKGFKGDRAMASAIFNRQDAHPALADVDLVVVRAHAPDSFEEWPLSEGLGWAKRCGFKTVPFAMTPTNQLDVDSLADALNLATGKSPYKMDGLVIFSDAAGLEATEDNPEHGIAFKVTEGESAVTTITKIEWKVSHTGKVVPKAVVKPVDFDGVVVTNCSIHNPKMCIANGWGVGAKVRIIRSGEIIPKIVETLKPVEFVMPTPQALGGKWHWDENETHIYLDESKGQSAERVVRELGRAMECIGIEHAAGSMAGRIAEIGCPDAMALISALYHDPVKLFMRAGASQKMAQKITDTLPATLTMPVMMKASNMFPEGLGERRFNKLMEEDTHRWYNVAERSSKPVSMDECVAYLGKVFGAEFHKNQLAFYKRLKALPHIPVKQPRKEKSLVAKTGPLKGQGVTMTGYRDANEEKAIMRAGGEIVPFGSKTTILLYRAGGKASTKIETARDAGLKVTVFSKLGL